MKRRPNDCAECARINGPHYIGPCDHGENPARRALTAAVTGRIRAGTAQPIVEQKAGAPSVYTPEQLRREARAMVKGIGKLMRFDIVVHHHHVQLRAHFIRNYNPARPEHVQAMEYTTLAL